VQKRAGLPYETIHEAAFLTSDQLEPADTDDAIFVAPGGAARNARELLNADV